MHFNHDRLRKTFYYFDALKIVKLLKHNRNIHKESTVLRKDN